MVSTVLDNLDQLSEDSGPLRVFAEGDVIMRQGEDGTAAYIIEEGRVEILVEKADGESQSMGTRGSGSIIGEMAIVDNAPRTATIVALEPCKLLEITQADFARRLQNADPVLRMTTQVILTRYRDTLTRAKIESGKDEVNRAEVLERQYVQQTDAVEEIKIANEFRAALQNQELSLHYQPIVNLQEYKIAGFEALMRWEHPERGFISPNVFIPVAEDTGLIVDASRWALKESCMALHRIEGHTGRHKKHFMSVNFTSHDFAADHFAETVYETVSSSDLDLWQIHLEITERLLLDQPENARGTLDMCRDAGMSIAIDDFGTGYSSLSYLHYFPIDTLKIDRSFVKDMHKNENSMELVKSIIALSKNMKLKTIAEGVEHAQEAATLKELGCDMAQGYFFARPANEMDITHLIDSGELPAF